jgi:hypothetical protein
MVSESNSGRGEIYRKEEDAVESYAAPQLDMETQASGDFPMHWIGQQQERVKSPKFSSIDKPQGGRAKSPNFEEEKERVYNKTSLRNAMVKVRYTL